MDGFQARDSRLDALVEGISDLFYALDGDWRFTHVNAGCAAYFGVDGAALIGRRIQDVFPEMPGTAIESRLAEAMRAGRLVEFETAGGHRPDRRIAARAFPFDGGLGVAFRDVTVQRQTAAAARRSEEMFSTMADNIPQLAWMADSEGWIFWYNKRWYDFTGTTLDEMAGWGWRKVHHPDHVDRVVARISESWRSGEPWEDLFPLRGKDGEYRWFLSRAQPIRDEGGQVVRWFGTNTDVTEQREHERALRRLAEGLERRVASRTRERDRAWRLSRDLLAIADLDGRLIGLNPAWTGVLGYTEDLRGRFYHEFVHPDDFTAVEARFRAVARGVPLDQVELRFRHADGGWRWVSWSAVADEGRVYAMGRDVTSQKAAEAALLQAQKLEALGQFTGGVAHDFNNLLQALGGCFVVLKQRLEGDDLGTTSLIQAGQQAVDRGAKLTQQLMAFARRQVLHPEPLDVRDRLLGMSVLLGRVLRADIELKVETAPDLWPIHADPTQFELAIINLAANARDAMPAGGELLVSACNHVAPDDRSGVRGEFVRLSITDTGTGMEPEVVGRAFDPFFTTKPVGKGSGLGLAMVHGFVRQSGGSSRIDSVRGVGTTVTLLLPRAAAAPAALENAFEQPPPSLQGARVLLVEDDAIVGNLVAAALEQLGLAVVRAGNGEEAMAVLRGDAPLDLLFTDVVMPGPLSGVDLAREAPRLRPGLPVLLTTGYSETEGVDARMRVLSKPYRMETLVAALSAELGPRDAA